MINHATTEVFFNDLELPADALIGEEGRGFRYVLDGMNAERILIAAECVGDGRFFIERAARYAGERVVFGRPIGANQGVQFPIARAHMAIEAANLMRWKACSAYMAEQPCGAEANMAKFLASEASWQAANAVPGHPRRLRLRRSTTTSSASSARPGSTRSPRCPTTWSRPTWASTCSACRGPISGGSGRRDDGAARCRSVRLSGRPDEDLVERHAPRAR